MRAWHACTVRTQQRSQRQLLRRKPCLADDFHLTVISSKYFSSTTGWQRCTLCWQIEIYVG